MDLENVLAIFIVYLGYVLSLAGLIQIGINQLKPLFLEPIKNRLVVPENPNGEQQYLIVIYVFRTVVTAAAYFGLWGGVEATRAIGLPVFIPDYGVAIATIGLVVLGEEVIHPVIERFYVLRDLAKQLRDTRPTGPTTANLEVKA